MSRSNKRIMAVAWLIAVLALGFFIVSLRRPRPVVPSAVVINAKKLVGSGHQVAVYRIDWPSRTLPKWNPQKEEDLIRKLPWRGADKDSLATALRDPSAKVDVYLKKQLESGVKLDTNEQDFARYRTTFGTGWGEPISSSKISYVFAVTGGYVHMGWVTDLSGPSVTGHSSTLDGKVVSPQRYTDGHHELLKLPDGTYERRVYVIAVS